MKCFKCGKDMDNPLGDFTLWGCSVNVSVNVSAVSPDATPEDIAYANRQLGKYSDGKGGCNVATCYECYIDGLFQGVGHVGYAEK